jgi:hypothetical protein
VCAEGAGGSVGVGVDEELGVAAAVGIGIVRLGSKGEGGRLTRC